MDTMEAIEKQKENGEMGGFFLLSGVFARGGVAGLHFLMRVVRN